MAVLRNLILTAALLGAFPTHAAADSEGFTFRYLGAVASKGECSSRATAVYQAFQDQFGLLEIASSIDWAVTGFDLTADDYDATIVCPIEQDVVAVSLIVYSVPGASGDKRDWIADKLQEFWELY